MMVGMGGSLELNRLLVVAEVIAKVMGDQAATQQPAHADPPQDVRRQVAECRVAVPAMVGDDD
jgi:hypothetical protein